MPVQGTAADIMKIAMVKVHDRLRGAAWARAVLQVHDELVFEVAEGERETLDALVRAQMGGAAELTVPLDVSVGTGRSWHEAAH
jgi:DNA polymerase-1